MQSGRRIASPDFSSLRIPAALQTSIRTVRRDAAAKPQSGISSMIQTLFA
jgi:hypothetical protein